MSASGYVELQVATHFSFLRGVSSCEELFGQAAALGLSALGIVDRNSVAGLVRAWEASKETGVRLIPVRGSISHAGPAFCSIPLTVWAGPGSAVY